MTSEEVVNRIRVPNGEELITVRDNNPTVDS